MRKATGKANQPNVMKSAQAMGEMGQVSFENAQAIAKINQDAAQQMAKAFQEKVAELMRVKNPQEAFDYVQAQVLQDAAKQVADYQTKVSKVMKANNQELAEMAQSLIEQSKIDLIHFVNEATANAPAGSEPYVSVFKSAFNNALQNFELIRASTADSFANFEKCVENMNQLSESFTAKPSQKRHSQR